MVAEDSGSCFCSLVVVAMMILDNMVVVEVILTTVSFSHEVNVAFHEVHSLGIVADSDAKVSDLCEQPEWASAMLLPSRTRRILEAHKGTRIVTRL